jgi:hypothetical protein
MFNTQLQHSGQRTTSRLLNFLISTLPHPVGSAFEGGLPAGSMRLDDARLLIGGTRCTFPVFRSAMTQAAIDSGYDVLLARHGSHPEVLDPVLWDVVVWSGPQAVSMNDLLLYAEADGPYWLVPSRMGPHIRIAPDGIHLEPQPAFATWRQRCDGIARAAAQITRAMGN